MALLLLIFLFHTLERRGFCGEGGGGDGGCGSDVYAVLDADALVHVVQVLLLSECGLIISHAYPNLASSGALK